MKAWKLAPVLLLLLFVVSGAMAQEVPPCAPCPLDADCIMPRCNGVFTNPEWLKIDFHRVNVEIENQIAHTSVDMKFENTGGGLVEGTWVFPLPLGATVDSLTMYINDQPIEAKILDAREAREVYDSIVRQYRDPALLEYIGTQAVQANIFPIPPGETRRIELSYTQALEVDNGLIHYVYPFDVTRLMNQRPVEDASISVQVDSNDPVSSIYSPSHAIVINRAMDTANHFRVGWEQSNYVADQDFSLYYGIASETINVNLLTYRESADGEGFFMLLVQPPLEPPQEAIVPRDLIVVLDQSGSMDGDKLNQAREAAAYVLDHLNPADRFNVVLFSTGWRVFSYDLESSALAGEAISWINGMYAEGGTDINGALTTALGMVDAERPTTILFMTDGLATEGITDTQSILENVDAAARRNVSIFTFGVGDDVDTFLLDAVVRDHHGQSSYVRPTERIDEVVASLYNKIGAPVLTNVELHVDGVMLDSIYPSQPLPDLFAGNQLTIVGRYRGSADDLDITLSGMVGGQAASFTYPDLQFRARAGGEPFIARLWATRRIGDLLNTIRLQGENPELVDSIVSLSVRYGIITPYTSFLIDENDILSQTGREEAMQTFANTARDLSQQFSGSAAVDAADAAGSLQAAEAPAPMAMPTMTAPGTLLADGEMQSQVVNPIQTVGDKTFILQDGVWTDTTFAPDTMTTQKVAFLSDEYFALLDSQPALSQYFALGDRVIVVLDGTAYEVTAEA
ncbi:MAG: VWA domain-containing protein [Anaerolineae bacterium]|nr:VWA domain-containing protein [Anaerolineae bacterium]